LYWNEVADLGFETTLLITSVKGQHDVANFNNDNATNIATGVRKFVTEIMASVIIFMGNHETLNQLSKTSKPVRILINFLFHYD
jgi:hypothetical protein